VATGPPQEASANWKHRSALFDYALGTAGVLQMPKRTRLPSHLPAGSKYVIESRGGINGSIWMHRHLELPDGLRVDLPPRLVPTGGTTSSNAARIPCARRTAARRRSRLSALR
jgi:hypothetical protein